MKSRDFILEELVKIKVSDVYNNVQRFLIKAGRGKNFSGKEFVDVRDFLLIKFLLDIGIRLGLFNNARLFEYILGKV